MCHRLNNSGAFQARDCKWESKFDENAQIYTMHEKISKTPELLPLHEKLEHTITKMEEKMDFMHNYLKAILKEDITLKFLVAVYAVMGNFQNHLKTARKFTNEEPGPAESSEPPATAKSENLSDLSRSCFFLAHALLKQVTARHDRSVFVPTSRLLVLAPTSRLLVLVLSATPAEAAAPSAPAIFSPPPAPATPVASMVLSIVIASADLWSGVINHFSVMLSFMPPRLMHHFLNSLPCQVTRSPSKKPKP